jgi:hypothetical protein
MVPGNVNCHHHGALPAAATVKKTDAKMPHLNSDDIAIHLVWGGRSLPGTMNSYTRPGCDFFHVGCAVTLRHVFMLVSRSKIGTVQ